MDTEIVVIAMLAGGCAVAVVAVAGFRWGARRHAIPPGAITGDRPAESHGPRRIPRRAMLEVAAAACALPVTTILLPGRSAAAETGRTMRAAEPALRSAPWDPGRGLLIRGATVVTMDHSHSVIDDSRVLIRDGRITAIWTGASIPTELEIGDPAIIDAGPDDLLFPGLINLHDHPDEDFLEVVLPPSNDAQPANGKAGTDPYGNRYQWNSPTTQAPEFRRLLTNPVGVLSAVDGLGLQAPIIRYAQAGALLGGETAIQGAPPNPGSDNAIIRTVDNHAFDGRIGPPRVDPIADFVDPELSEFTAALRMGRYDAWMIHLAEGVTDADRRSGDPFSSRAEFAALKSKGLLTDATVIIHGTALERADFAEMRSAPTARDDGVTDGLGAKLVWSPQSNLVLYGTTTNVYEALAEGVLVCLGTDWTPSGSRTLLHELKVAAAALRDPVILGRFQELHAPASVAVTAQRWGDDALDQLLVDMVTRNPALALHWFDRVGSIEVGKIADLVLLHRPPQVETSPRGARPSPYRSLIEATAADVGLVLVGGRPRSGTVEVMFRLVPHTAEVVTDHARSVRKAVDVVSASDGANSGPSLADLSAQPTAAAAALGGDHPPAGGGPGPADNTYTYLQQRVAAGAAAGLPAADFRALLAEDVGETADGYLNLEAVRLNPVLGDDFLRRFLDARLDPATGLLAAPDAPYRLYPANFNWVSTSGNLLAGLPV